MNKPLDIGTHLKVGWETFTANAAPLILGLLLAGLIGALSLGICIGPMMIGYNKMVLRAVEGESVAAGDVFEGFQRFGASFVLFLLMGLAIMVGFALLVIPGFVLLFMFAFAPWLMAADDNLGAVDALKASVELFKADVGGTVVFVLVHVIVQAAGNFVPFGGLLTGPVAAGMLGSGVLAATRSVGAGAHVPA